MDSVGRAGMLTSVMQMNGKSRGINIQPIKKFDGMSQFQRTQKGHTKKSKS